MNSYKDNYNNNYEETFCRLIEYVIVNMHLPKYKLIVLGICADLSIMLILRIISNRHYCKKSIEKNIEKR